MTPEDRLATIAAWHTSGTDRCDECGNLAPCDTQRMADGTHPDLNPQPKQPAPNPFANYTVSGGTGGHTSQPVTMTFHTTGADPAFLDRIREAANYFPHADRVQRVQARDLTAPANRCPRCNHWNTGVHPTHRTAATPPGHPDGPCLANAINPGGVGTGVRPCGCTYGTPDRLNPNALNLPRCPRCGHWNTIGRHAAPCAALIRGAAVPERVCGCTYDGPWTAT